MKTREELLDRYENEPTASKFSKSDKVLHFTPKELKEVLSAPTEEQQSCEMCHATLSGRAYTIADYQDQIKNFVSGLNPDAIKNIKYCQWCGRKLGDD
jgi:hypothetical protein